MRADCRDLAEKDRVVAPALVAALAMKEFAHQDWPNWRLHRRGIDLADGLFLEPLDFSRAQVPCSVSFARCTFRQEVALDDVRVEGTLDITGSTFNAPYRMARATLTGGFHAEKAKFERGLFAEEASCTNWFMDGAEVKGCFDINSATITGQFSASDGATFDNAGSIAVEAHSVRADSWFMDGVTVRGTLSISSATIVGPFSATQGAIFENPGQAAIQAHSITVGSWFMEKAIVRGSFGIQGAAISGQLEAESASFENPTGDAILCVYSSIADGIILRDAKVTGGINLSSTVISKTVALDRCEVFATRHRAISLSDAHVIGETRINDAKLYGHFHAHRARFDGRLSFQGASITASSVARSRCQISAELARGYHEIDEARQDRCKDKAISLVEARVDGRLVLPEQCPDGIVDLSRAHCDTLEDRAAGWPPPLAKGKRACGARVCIAEQSDVQHFILDGFEYDHLEFPTGEEHDTGNVAAARIRWLTSQSAQHLVKHFNPQPWRQAASVLRAMGYEEAAQAVAIERRVRQRISDGVSPFQRAVSWLLHQLADYGFNPWKTVSLAVLFVILCAGVYGWGTASCNPNMIESCEGQAAFTQVRFGDIEPGKAYPELNALLYSADAFLPLLDLGTEPYWRPNTSAWVKLPYPVLTSFDRILISENFPIGWILYILSIIETIVGALIVAVAVTGFTGLLTRDER